MLLKVTIDGQVFHIQTNNDPLASQLAALCPIEQKFRRSGNHEYYGRLTEALSDTDSVKTTKAYAGELMYFGGWNCLSLLFADADVAPYQLVKLGAFQEEITNFLLEKGSDIKVKIEVEQN